jgi:hypothetical protein
VENQFSFRFPPDLRAFLQTALPRGERFPDWRHGNEAALREWFDMPLEGILFDVQYNQFWLDEWGRRPAALSEALRITREQVAAAPRLIPVFGHRMMPDEPTPRATRCSQFTRRTSSITEPIWPVIYGTSSTWQRASLRIDRSAISVFGTSTVSRRSVGAGAPPSSISAPWRIRRRRALEGSGGSSGNDAYLVLTSQVRSVKWRRWLGAQSCPLQGARD